MLEMVEETILAILYNDLPKNGAGRPAIYGHQITGWQVGERTPLPNNPQITIQANNSVPKRIASCTYMVGHNINVELSIAKSSPHEGECNIQEMCRVIYEVLLNHSRFWVLDLCPFCQKFTLSPQHFTIAHNDVMAPYVTTATNNFSTLYYSTHLNTDTLPTLELANIAAAAFELLVNDVRASNTVANITNYSSPFGLTAIQTSILNLRRPIRLLDELLPTDIKTSDGGKETQGLRSATFSLTAREIYRQTAFGPNGVPTIAIAGIPQV